MNELNSPHRDPGAGARLREQGVIPVMMTPIDAATANAAVPAGRIAAELPAAGDERALRVFVVRTVRGAVRIGVPRGLAVPAFRVELPEQEALVRLSVRRLAELAAAVGAGTGSKGLGASANQCALLVDELVQVAADDGWSREYGLTGEQRQAVTKTGAVPAVFRYQAPDGTLAIVVNPRDASAREPGGGSFIGGFQQRFMGCLSGIDVRGTVTSPVALELDAVDLSGQPLRFAARGPAAALMYHETQHLTGGADGLSFVASERPLVMLDDYVGSGYEAERNWDYPDVDFTAGYIETHDRTHQRSSAAVHSDLVEQGLLVPAGSGVNPAV